MEDTLALIRLLAETPSDVSPLVRTRDLIEGTQREQVVREGVTPAGNAAPPAEVKIPETQKSSGAKPSPPAESRGTPVTAAHSPNVLGRGVKWIIPPEHVHSTVEVRPAVQSDGRPASPTPRRDTSVPAANPRTGIPSIGGEVEIKTVAPSSAPPVDVMSPETFFGKAATPHIMRAIEGIPVEIRRTQHVQAVSSPTPTATVTVTVPPAFPIDPAQAFARVDEEMRIPPRQSSWQLDQIQKAMNLIPDDTLPSEAVVANNTANNIDDGMERWVL